MSKIDQVIQARQSALGDTPARQRISMLLDSDSFVELDGFATVDGEPCGVVCGYGSVMGSPVAVFAQDSSQQNGAVGKVHADKILKVYDLALKTGIPVVGIYDSHGARLGEGIGALAAYGDLLGCISNMSGVVPQISLVLGTCAGTSAMMACSADFVVMSEKGEFFMAPPAAGSQSGSAKAAAEAGVAHLVCADDEAACQQARRILSLLPLNNLAAAPITDFADPSADLRAVSESGACPKDAILGSVDADSAIELLGEFGTRVYTGLATMGGYPCGVVAAAKEKLCARSSAKIAKLVSVCDAFQIPVLTFVNCTGFEADASAELCGSVRDMARLAHVYAEATTAKIAVITGNAYGAAYVALAGRGSGSDYTIAWPGAVISALEPKTAVAFLHGDKITADKSREAVEAEYIETEASPMAAAAGGYIDDVIDPALTRAAILSALDLLSAKRVQKNPKKHSNLPL